jgi:hypothetical protein
LEQRRGREEGLGELAQTVSTNLLALTGNGGGELEWSMVRMVDERRRNSFHCVRSE